MKIPSQGGAHGHMKVGKRNSDEEGHIKGNKK